MKSNSRKSLFLATGVLLILSACGGSSGDPDTITDTDTVVVTGASAETDTTTDLIDLPGLAVFGLGGVSAAEIFNPWLASIRTYRRASFTPGSGDADIATLQYSEFRTIQDHIDFYTSSTEDMDTCEITDSTDSSSTGSGTSDTSSNIPFVSGGQEVVINSTNGTWYTIPQGEAGRYEVNNELPAAIPSGASLSIPGDVFPSVGAFPILEPSAPIRISPTSDSLSIVDDYEWVPEGGPGVFVRIAILEYDANGDFIDFRIGCNVIDDGEFELPIDALDVIASAENSTFQARYTRRHRRLDLVEGVAIYSRISVAE